MTEPSAVPIREALASKELHQLVERMVRRRVPASDVDDVVQTVLVAALASASPPDDIERVRRWLSGITRNKVADFHRQRGRAQHVELPDQLEGAGPELEARDWANWAEKQTAGNSEAKRTLGWMAREGGGEKLAHIAEDEQLPPAQVRQRVSRMRRWMKKRWMAELAAVAGVAAMALFAWWTLRQPKPVTAQPYLIPDALPSAMPPAIDGVRAHQLRRQALKDCGPKQTCSRDEWKECVAALDEAAKLDPAGDTEPWVQGLRKRAQEQLAPPKLDNKDSQPTPQKLNPTRPKPRPTKMIPSEPTPPPAKPSSTPFAPPAPGKKLSPLEMLKQGNTKK